MRSFIRMSMAAVALFAVANVATAQGAPGGRGGPQGQRTVDRLMTGITLTADQTARIAPLVKSFDSTAATAPALPADADSTTRAASRAARMKLSTDFQRNLKALLNPEQTKTFEANVAAQAARGRGRGGE